MNGAIGAPSGTIAPGTLVKVGQFTVTVQSFLSQGGFAHVYKATSSAPIPSGSPYATTTHVLKRIAVPDKAGVEQVGKEVEVMKALRNHPKIVNFIEASFSEVAAQSGTSKSYEIFILMEWCAGGGIIDMMNTRLQHRMTEQELLKIFSDTVEGVAYMHYQSPPLIHRDLKVENILLSSAPSISAPAYPTYKLCDFGSTTTPLLRIPTSVADIQALEADINSTTTLQYRAPELMDVWSRRGYDEKIDIWALGVLLYKLCYYTTPFEESGPLGIINAQYKIPSHPAYSNELKLLIGTMLQEKASTRPNIFQLHVGVCRLRGTAVRLIDKYTNAPPLPSSSPIRSSSTSASTPSSKKVPQVPRYLSTPSSSSDTYSSLMALESDGAPLSNSRLAETIAPMRRGRPGKSGAPVSSSAVAATSSMAANGFGDALSSATLPSAGNSSSTSLAFGDSFSPGSSSTSAASLIPTLTPASAPAPATVPSSLPFADLILPIVSLATSLSENGPNTPSSTTTDSLDGELNKKDLTGEPSSMRLHTSAPLPSSLLNTSSSPRERANRSSQTSPHLMSTWMPPISSSLVTPTPTPTSPAISYPSTPVAALRSTSNDAALRLDDSPPASPRQLPVSACGAAHNFSNKPGKFRPIRYDAGATPRSSGSNASNSAMLGDHVPSPKKLRALVERIDRLEAGERFPALQDIDNVGNGFGLVQSGSLEDARPKTAHVDDDDDVCLPIIEKDDIDSSDDERSFLQTSARPLTPRSGNRHVRGVIEVIPTAPVIPESPNRQQGITTSVEKYETISSTVGAPATSPTFVRRWKRIDGDDLALATTKTAPPPMLKPARLRRSSSAAPSTSDLPHVASSSSSSFSPPNHTSGTSPSISLPISSTPINPASLSQAHRDRLPFKPVAPPLSPASARPLPPFTSQSRASLAGSSQTMTLQERILSDSLKGEETRKHGQVETQVEGEKEQPFAGVSSMVSRWNMGTELKDLSSGEGGKRRKEWAVV